MRKGLIISLTLHSAILFWALVSFPDGRDLEPMKDTPIAVDLVTPAEVSRVKAGKKDAEKKVAAVETPPEKPKPAEKEAKKEPEKPKRAAPPPPAPKPAEAEPAPKPVEKKAEPKPAPKAEPEKVADSAPMPVRRPTPPAVSRPLQREETKVAANTPSKKKTDFDADQIAALLDKRPDAAQKAPPPRQEVEQAPEPPEPAQGQASGRDQQMSISEIDALRARISQCWSPPVGGLGSDAIRVRIRMQLKQDGMLAAEPQVVNRDGSPFFMAAADSAVRAVMLCQPYSLPDEKYAQWRDMILNFDPREMFGG